MDDAELSNRLAFDAGVEIDQLLALGMILIAMAWWRRTAVFPRQAFACQHAADDRRLRADRLSAG